MREGVIGIGERGGEKRGEKEGERVGRGEIE